MTSPGKQEAPQSPSSPCTPHPPTCPLLFSSTCLFSQTAADCRRRRRAMSSDCELGLVLGRWAVVTSAVLALPRPRLRGDAEFVATGCIHGDRAVRGC